MSEDGRLLRQYREQGSQAAFARLAARHLGFVYATCLRETGDAALAEDAAQVVFLLLARRAPALRPEQSLSGWLFQTARFAAKNARRREARRRAWEERAVQQTPAPGHEENALWDRLGPAVNDALAALGAKDREAVLLRFADGLSFPELGAALGTSEDAARMRLNRALSRLRQFFAKQGVTLSVVALAALLADCTTQAAPAACAAAVAGIGGGVPTSPSVHLHLQGVQKAMTISKLKLAATITIGVAITGSLPFVTRAQNHPRRAGHKAAGVATPSGVGLALSPVPPAVPKSLHIVYSITDGLAPRRPPLPADYWVTGPDAARWASNGRYPMTIATNGRTWTELMEPPNTGSAIKVDARTAAMSPVPTQPSLRVERARSWNNSATGVYSPGVLAGEIPFLGFGQPGKIYRGKPNKVTKTAHGWEEHCRVPYGYGQSAAIGKPSLVDAVLTYDRQGRLVRFRRNRAGDIWENSVFSDFTMIGAMEIPRLVRYAETDEAGGRVVTDMAVTYQAQSLDEKPSVHDWFAMQHPPVGALVQDYRFADHQPTPGLGGENSSGVLYRYSGRMPLDEESRAKYRQSQDGPAH